MANGGRPDAMAPIDASGLAKLYPPIEPFDCGVLDTGDGGGAGAQTLRPR